LSANVSSLNARKECRQCTLSVMGELSDHRVQQETLAGLKWLQQPIDRLSRRFRIFAYAPAPVIPVLALSV
jgi:hypothetical protein